jgi:hypothetical protein
MSELARRRNARDLWISRGHLAAAASGAASLAMASFAIGFFLGEHRRPPVVEAPPFAPDEGLVELLARIETTAALPGGVDEALTFPDLLRSESAPSVPAVAAPREGRVVLIEPAFEGPTLGGPNPSAAGATPGDSPPPGTFTVVVGRGTDPAEVGREAEALRRQGLAAWVSVALVDGEWAYRIAYGGFDDEAAARRALALAREAGVPGAVEPILPASPRRLAPAAPPSPPAPDPAPALGSSSGGPTLGSPREGPMSELEVDALEVEEPGLEPATVEPLEPPTPEVGEAAPVDDEEAAPQ